MSFCDSFNEYIRIIGCTSKELSEASGVSAATVSRFRSGVRAPSADSPAIGKLAAGIALLAKKKGVNGMTQKTLEKELNELARQKSDDADKLRNNLNALISVMKIRVNALAKFTNYDASYLSRIRAGKRSPADPAGFAHQIAGYAVRTCSGEAEKALIANLTGSSPAELEDEYSYLRIVEKWLFCGSGEKKELIESFLHKLDEFNLDEYIGTIRFNEMKVPSVPFQLPTSKSYFGLEEMKASELDFMKATVLSKSAEPVFMYSDMPIEKMSKDSDFVKKWMFGLALLLKKGLHLNIIHHIDRPLAEMLLGLESWIPMYMTGQVSPYYLKGTQNNVFCHFLRASGGAALTGECIAGYQHKGRYILTKNKDEVAYYKTRAACLLKKAQPLMEIYWQDSENVYQAFLQSAARTAGKRHTVLAALPIYTATDVFLKKVLQNNAVPAGEREKILNYATRQRELLRMILEENIVVDEGAELTREEFNLHPMALSLSGMFYNRDILYSYEEYLEHLALTRGYEREHPNYSFLSNPRQIFRNIEILVHEGKWVMISKNKAPVIHFVIRHPNLVGAVESFIQSY